VLAVLVVNVVAGVVPQDWLLRITRRIVFLVQFPPIHSAGTPTDRNQPAMGTIADDSAQVVVKLKHSTDVERLGVDSINHAPAFGTIFGDRDPELLPVEVDSPGVIDGTFVQVNVSEQSSLRIELKQMTAPLIGLPVENLHGGEEDAVADSDHPLRVIGGEFEGDFLDLLPSASSGEFLKSLRDDCAIRWFSGEACLGRGPEKHERPNDESLVEPDHKPREACHERSLSNTGIVGGFSWPAWN
jgi:hypothetical protein